MAHSTSRIAWWIAAVAIALFVGVTLSLLVVAGVRPLLAVPFWFDTLFFQYNVFLLLMAVAIEPFLAWSYLAVMRDEKERRLYHDLGDELWSRHETKIHEYLASQFAPRAYLGSVLAMMSVVAFGAVVLLLLKPVPRGSGLDFMKGANLLVLGPFIEDIGDGGHFHFVVHSLTGISFGFLGAYLYSLTQLARAYFTVDLTPNSFIAATVRIIFASVMTLIISFAFIFAPVEGSTAHERWLAMLPIIGFAFGYFPDWALRAIKQTALKFIGLSVEGREYGSTSLRLVSGMSDLHAARMEREGVDNAENLATLEPLELAIRTGFSYRQIRQWVSEARLRIELTTDFEPFVEKTGIRTHLQLVTFAQEWQKARHPESAAEFLASASGLPIAGKLMTLLMISQERPAAPASEPPMMPIVRATAPGMVATPAPI